MEMTNGKTNGPKISEVIFSEYSERFVLLLVRFSFLEYVLVGAVAWKHLPKNLKFLFVLIINTILKGE